MKKMLKYIFTFLALLLFFGLLIQLIPYGRDHVNPPLVSEPAWDNPQTRVLAQRACFDCHSNETVWSWYSNIAPVSWLVYRDVALGREHLNFSEWGAHPSIPKGEGERGGQLGSADIQEVLVSGEMPPFQYLIMHPEARLSLEEKQSLIAGLNQSLK